MSDPKAQADISDDDDIPELEDMTEQVSRLKVKDDPAPAPAKNPAHPPKPKPDYTLTVDEEQVQREKHQKELDKKLGEAFAKSMQAQPKKKAPAPKNPNITEVKATEPNKNPLEFKEVQENMCLGDQVLKTKDQWLNQDLMAAVAKDPKLLAGFSDPEVMAAVNMMQTDAKGAMEKYGNNPKVRDFLKIFSGMMGNHFEKIGAEEKKVADQKAAEKAAEQKIVDAQQAELQKKLDDPMVKKIFEDPAVQNFIRMMQTSKEPVDFYDLQRRNPELAHKIQFLAMKGILNTHSEPPK